MQKSTTKIFITGFLILSLTMATLATAAETKTAKIQLTSADQVKTEKHTYSVADAALVKSVYGKDIICTITITSIEGADATMVHVFSDGKQKAVKLK